MLKQWNKGITEKGVCMDENKESRPCKRLSHSIEEILSRPAVQRSWSVIKESSRLPQLLSCAGTLQTILSCLKKKKHAILQEGVSLICNCGYEMQCS